MTREEWLNAATDLLRTDFSSVGAPLPEVRVTCGLFEHDFHRDSNVLALCCFHTDEDIEICMASRLQVSLEVLVTLTHELVRAAIGHKELHEDRFRTVARSIGLSPCSPDWTETTSVEALVEALAVRFQEISEELGEYPREGNQ